MRDLSVIKPLDGLRAMAIVLVLIWHYVYCQLADAPAGMLHWLKFFTFCTWSGVDLFFVLSGFLIGRILIANKQSPDYFKTFYLRRVFRIFPAYYLIVLAFVAIACTALAARLPWLMEESFPLYSYVLYIQNFWMKDWNFGANWLSVTWSLAIEEQFYLLLPLTIFLIKDKWLPLVLIIGIVAAPFFRLFLPGLDGYVLLPARMDALLLGVLIARYYWNGYIQTTFAGKQNGLWLTLIILLVLVFICGQRPGGENIGGVWIHTLLALFYGVLLILVLTLDAGHALSKFLSGKLLRGMALVSFMVYLTHQIFSGLLHELILDQEPKLRNATDALVTLLALVITFGFSALSYRVFEKPLLQLGKKYKY